MVDHLITRNFLLFTYLNIKTIESDKCMASDVYNIKKIGSDCDGMFILSI